MDEKLINKYGDRVDANAKTEIPSDSINISEPPSPTEIWTESELVYRTIFETSGTAMMIFGEDMLITLVNGEFEKLSGFCKAEIEHQKKWTEFIADADLRRMQDYHRQRRIDAAAVPANYEFKFRNREGNIRDIYIAVNIVPGTKSSVVSFTDVTERKQMEEQLRNSESQYRSLAEDMDALVCTFLPDGTLIYVNRVCCECFQKDRDELVGHSFLDFLPDAAIRQQVLSSYSALSIDQPMETHEQPVLLPDGTEIWQRWTNRAIFGEGEKIVGLSVRRH